MIFIVNPGGKLALIPAGVAYSVVEVLGVLAYKCAPAREISVFSYSDAIFSAGLSFLLFGQLPYHIQYSGYVLIIIGAIILYGFNTKKHIPVEDNEVVIN